MKLEVTYLPSPSEDRPWKVPVFLALVDSADYVDILTRYSIRVFWVY